MTGGLSFGNSTVFHRDPTATYPVLKRGKGFHVWSTDGTRFVDLSSGLASPVGIGHGREDIAATMAEQAGQLAFANNARVSTDRQEELAARLVGIAPTGMARAMFSSGGSEANEIALRLARQFHLARGEDRWKVISLSPSYHGATAGAMSMSSRSGLADDYRPYMFAAVRLAAPIRFRGPYAGMSDDDLVAASRRDLVGLIEREGPGSVSALIGEVVSTTAGMAVPPAGYWPMVRDVCDEFGVLVIVDEAVTGMARAGHLFACDAFCAQPDLVVVAKGLTGGYMPMAATLIHERVVEALVAGGRGMRAVHSHAGNPLACAVALKVLDIMEQESTVERVRERAPYLEQLLRTKLGGSPVVGEIRGLGYMWCVEFAMPIDRSVIDASFGVPGRVWAGMLDRGYLLPASRYGSLVGDCATLYPVFGTDHDVLASGVEALVEVAHSIERHVVQST